jgi:hypothetical protein
VPRTRPRGVDHDLGVDGSEGRAARGDLLGIEARQRRGRGERPRDRDRRAVHAAERAVRREVRGERRTVHVDSSVHLPPADVGPAERVALRRLADGFRRRIDEAEEVAVSGQEVGRLVATRAPAAECGMQVAAIDATDEGHKAGRAAARDVERLTHRRGGASNRGLEIGRSRGACRDREQHEEERAHDKGGDRHAEGAHGPLFGRQGRDC